MVIRHLVIVLVLINACNSKKAETIISATIDTVQNRRVESFDLQVRKYEDPRRCLRGFIYLMSMVH